jgi:hypothetical protein
MAAAPSMVVVLRMLSGALIWAVHFIASYGFTTLACARDLASIQWLTIGIVPWVVGGATAIALLVALSVIVAAVRTDPAIGFVEWMTASVAALASLAIVWEALPAMMVPACA